MNEKLGNVRLKEGIQWFGSLVRWSQVRNRRLGETSDTIMEGSDIEPFSTFLVSKCVGSLQLHLTDKTFTLQKVLGVMKYQTLDLGSSHQEFI